MANGNCSPPTLQRAVGYLAAITMIQPCQAAASALHRPARTGGLAGSIQPSQTSFFAAKLATFGEGPELTDAAGDDDPGQLILVRGDGPRKGAWLEVCNRMASPPTS